MGGHKRRPDRSGTPPIARTWLPEMDGWPHRSPLDGRGSVSKVVLSTRKKEGKKGVRYRKKRQSVQVRQALACSTQHFNM